jgi:hypothetical protein
MYDPFRALTRWTDRGALDRFRTTDTEEIVFRDRVQYAVSLIRDHELRLWFEADWSAALRISQICPRCQVYSIPPGARLVDDLNAPPPWRISLRLPATL